MQQELLRTEEGIIIDLETGEVISDPERVNGWDILFGKLTPPDINLTLTPAGQLELEECVDFACERIANVASRAKAYRTMAEKKAKPLEARVNRYLELLKPWAKTLAELSLPRYKTDQKSGKKAGDFQRKTLDLSRAALKFTKRGGDWIFPNDRVLIDYCKTDPELRQCIESKTVMTVNLTLLLDKLSEEERHDLGIEKLALDEFHTMRLVLPEEE